MLHTLTLWYPATVQVDKHVEAWAAAEHPLEETEAEIARLAAVGCSLHSI